MWALRGVQGGGCPEPRLAAAGVVEGAGSASCSWFYGCLGHVEDVTGQPQADHPEA